jgi:hypothetical protein
VSKHEPTQADIDALRGSLVTLVHRESGVKVVAPKVTTKQQDRSAALLGKFFDLPPYDAPGVQVVSRDWFVSFDCSTLPESASVAWTADLTGGATGTVVSTGGIYSTFSLVDVQSTYSHGLTNSLGTTLEAWLRVASADLVTGGLLRVEDGTQRFDVRLLTGGLYIDDGSSAILTRNLSTFNLLRMAARSNNLALYVGGQLAGTGAATGETTNSLVAWGNDVDAADCALEVVRVRAAEGV